MLINRKSIPTLKTLFKAIVCLILLFQISNSWAQNNALYFDGYDDNAITTTLDTDTSVVPVTTWEAWVYPTTNDGEYRMIMGVEDGGCDRFVAMNGGNFVVGIGTAACLWSPVAIDLNKWQHIAVVYDEGAGIAKFYKNGVEYISGLSGHTAAVKFGIGCSQHNGYGPAGATQFFQGSIDEVRVWEVARTQNQIQSTMYNELVGNETNLLAYYNFNQGTASESNYSVTTLTDVSGHGHDAPLINFALSGSTSNWVESYAMVVPTAWAATSITDTGFTANWTAPFTGTYTHYVLDVATDPTFTYRVSGYDGLSVAGTSENVTGLPTGLTYYFRVRADKTSVTGQGAFSNVISVAVGTAAVMTPPGNGLYFNGTTNFVTVPSSASPFTGNSDHTIEFDVLYKGGQTGDRWLLWYGTLAGDQIEVIGYNGETGLIKDHHVSAGNDITATTAALVPNKWTHVAMVYTGASRTMAIYINGAYVETFTYASDLAIPDYSPLQLGTFYSIADGVNFTCHMALDEVRIWDVARTESEIRATMYNELAGSETNLKVYYNFNQGTASGTNTPINTLTDRTANGYHGTLTNFDLVGDTSNWVESYAMVVPTSTAATNITSAGFTANWTAPAIGIVTDYLLDVATDPSFTALVSGYDGLSVSGSSQAITGLNPGATYYYRVRADKTSVTGQGAYASVQTVQLAVDYTITFVPPAGLPSMPNQTIAAGATANLSANRMIYPGYTFAGWATTPGGAVVYSDGTSYIMGAADVTLYSTWIVNNPTGVISGNATVCAGTPTQLSIDLTGQGPWSGTLSDGTYFTGSNNPLVLSVTPTESSIYTIATLSSATATATAGDLGGSAVVTVTPFSAPIITGNLNLCTGSTTTLSTEAGVQGTRQYASEVLDFSSEYTSDCGPWSSCQILGEPDMYPEYGDSSENWANESPNGGLEYLELGFSNPAPINYIDIYETYNPGSINQVSVKNSSTGLYEVVYTSSAEVAPEEARILHITFPLTTYDVSSVRIDMDTALFDSFIQIDAVAIGANDSNTYLWSTGETTPSIAVSTAGNYTVTATNTSGCSSTSAISEVRVKSCISGDARICAGTSTQLSIALTGQGPWYGTLSDGTAFSGSDSPLLVTVSPTANTNYTIATLSNATSQDLGGSAMVTVNPLPTAVIEATTTNAATATITASSSIALCEGGNVTLTAQADNTPAGLVPLNEDGGATLAVGLRKLKSDYSGPALRLRRSSDNQEQDFGFAGYNLDTDAISTWLNGATGFCTTLYDQSVHSGNLTQANTTAQPMYVESGINNKPILHFTTTQSLVNQINYPAPFSVIYGSRVTGQSERALAAQYNNWLLGYWGGSKDQAFFEGWITTPGIPQSDTTYNIYAATGNGITSSIYKNGNQLISNDGGLQGPNGIGFNTGENSDFDFTDLMVFGTELSIQNIQKYNNSIGQYYGSGTVALNTYQWSTGATTPSIAVSTAGDYTVTVTNNYGCAATSVASSVTLSTCEAKLSGIISGNATVCAGTPTQLSIALTGQGFWSGTLSDGTFFSGAISPLLVAVTPTANTTYTIATLSSSSSTATAENLSGTAVVTMTAETTNVTQITACTSYTWIAGNGQTYTSSGNYTYTTGCHTETLVLNISPLTMYYVDNDHDGYGSNNTVFLCETVAPSGYATTNFDCNDADPTKYASLTITKQPDSAASVCLTSGTVSLTASVTSSFAAPLNYVWQVQTAAQSGNTWNTVSNSALYNGSTTASLGITAATAAMSGYKYRLTASSLNACPAISDTTVLKVNPKSVAGTISGVTTVCNGSSTSLTVNNNVGMVQWQSAPASAGPYTAINSATASIYTTPNMTATTYYKAVVTSGACPSLITAAAAVGVSQLSVAGAISGAGTSCSGVAKTLTLSGHRGTAIQWESSVNGTDNSWTAIAGTTTTTYSATLTSDTYYRVVVKSGACSPVTTTPVLIDVVSNPVAGIITPDNPVICSGTSTILTVSNSVGSIQWQSATTLTGTYTNIVGAKDTTYTTANLTATKYYKAVVSVGAGTCGAPVLTMPVAVTVIKSVAGTVSGGGTVCVNSPKIQTLAGNTGAIVWQVSDSAIGTFTTINGETGTSYSAPTNVEGTYYYRALVTNTSCTPTATTAVAVIVKPTVVAGTILASSNICIGASSGNVLTLTNYTPDVSIQWQSATTLTGSYTNIAGATAPTYTILTTTAGTKFYKAVVTNGACVASTETYRLSINPLTVSGTIAGAGSVCIGGTKTLTVTGAVGTIQWESSANNTDWTKITDATASTYSVPTTTAGIFYYHAVVSSGACNVATTATASVIVNPASVAETIFGPANVCIGATSDKTLTVSHYVGTAIQWQSAASLTGTYANIAGSTAATYDIVTTTTGTKYYKAIVTSGACPASTSTAYGVTINRVSVAGTISGAASFCVGAGVKTLTLAGAVGNIQWESSANNTDWATIVGATASTYSVPTTTAGTFYYRAVVTSGACSAATTATATVIVNPLSVAGNISGPGYICINSTTNRTLTLSNYLGTIQWQSSASPTGTFINIAGATAATYNVVTATVGNTYYKAVVTSGICSASTTLPYQVTINPASYAGTITGGGSVCFGTAKTLRMPIGAGFIQWQISTNNINYTDIAGANRDYTYIVPTNTAVGTYYYRAVMRSFVCTPVTSAEVTVIVNPITVAGSISGPTSICINATTNRTLTLSDYVGTIQWQSSATLAGTYANIVGATSATYDVVTTTAGTKYYRAVVTSGACSSSTSGAYGVTINPAPVAGAISGAGSFCIGGTKTLTLVGSTGTIAWQVSDSATGTFTTLVGETSTTYVAPTDNEGTYYCRALVTNTSCTTVATTPVAVIVKPTVVAGTILGPSNVCIGATAGNVLSLTNYTPGVTIQWQTATTLTGAYTNIAGATATTYSVLTSTAGTKYFKAVVTNGACVATTEAYELTINSLSVAGTVSGQGHVCINGSNKLILNGAVGSIQWERSINGTDWKVENGKTNPYNNVDTTEDGKFYYHAIVTNGACGLATTATATIEVNPTPKKGNITGLRDICIGDYDNNTLTLSNYVGTSIQWYSANNANGAGTPISGATGDTYSVPVYPDNTRFYKAHVKSGACTAVVFDTFKVTVFSASVAGTLSGGGALCSAGGSRSLTLTGSVGLRQWEMRTDNGSWTPIVGETGTTYSFSASTIGATEYRVRISAGTCADVFSNSRNVNIAPQSVAGNIVGIENINVNDTTNNTLTLSGYTSSTKVLGIYIQWRSATTLNGTYTDIVGATADTYTVPTTNVGTTYYKAVVISGRCSASTSDAFKVTINPAPVTGTINAVKNTICYNTNTTLKIVGALGTVLWYYSTNNLDWYSTGVTGTTYTTANLTTTTYYRVAVSSGVFAPVISPTPMIITVSPQSVATAVTGAGAVCNGSLLTLETGYVGTIQWQKATTLTGAYTNIAGATSDTYTSNNLGTAYYQAVVTSGVCAASKSVPVGVIVDKKPVAGIIAYKVAPLVANICIGGVKELVIKDYFGSLQWESSLDGTNWATIAGATNDTYSVPTDIVGVYYFRVVVSSGVCSSVTTLYKNVIVNPLAVAGSISGNTNICINDNTNNTLTLTGYAGTIQWKRAATLSGAYANIDGATAATYTVPTDALGTSFYRAAVDSGACTTGIDTFRVNIVAPPVAGTISGGGSACISSIKTLTVTGAEGNIQWQSSNNDGISWNPISEATTTTYSVPTTTVGTKIYRVRVTIGTCAAVVSDVPAVVTVIPLSVAGTILGPHAIAINDTTNNILTLSDYQGTAIQWQSASVLVGPYTAIAGATTDTYIVPTTTAGTKYYRVLVSNGVCAAITTAGFFGVTINPASVAGTINAVAKTICYNTGTTLNVTRAVGTILWQYSTNNLDWFDTATTGATYTTGNLTTTTYYRVSVTSGLSAPVTTAIPMVITVSPQTVATAVTGAGAMCYGFTAGLTLTTGYIGAIKWQTAIDNSTWTTIASATAATYTIPATTTVGPHYYRAVITSGACSAVPTDSVLVNVAPRSVAGTLSGATSLCAGTNSAVLTLTGSRGTIQWQSASPLVTSVYTNVSDATNSATYTATNLTATTYYKAIVQNEVCPALATAAVKVTIASPIVTSITGGDVTICPGIARALVLTTGYTGTINWQKSSSFDGTYTTIVGANAATYQVNTEMLANTTTYYRVLLTNGTCTATSVPVFIAVLPAVNGGTVTGNAQVINNTSTTLTAAGYDQGALKWQKATVVIDPIGLAIITASSWSDVALGTGITTAVYTTNSLTNRIAYRLAVTNNTNGCKGYGEPIVVRILKNPTIVETHTSGLSLAKCTSTTTTNTLILSISGLDLVPSQYTWELLSSSNVWAAIGTIGVSSTKNQTFATSGTYNYRVGIQYTNNPTIFYSSVFNLQVGDCPSTGGGGGKRITGSANKFDVLVYPNPSSTNFNLNITTSSAENVEVKVYDMIGKLIHKMEGSPSKVAGLPFGDRYPSGVYNVIVSQGTEEKTLRLIKK
jgi:hypothetical protein